MRILHLADLHLGWQPAFLGAKSGERAKERDKLLERAVDYALDEKNRIQAVVIAGDLFDNHRPDTAIVEYALDKLQCLTRAGKFLITVPGNHDEITYYDSIYRTESARWPGILATNPNVEEIACVELDGKKVSFYGLAYTAGATRTSPALSQFPKSNAHRHVGVFHGSLDWDTGDRSLPISGEAVTRSGYDCLTLGHIHRHSVRYLGKTVACYAGATEGKNFNDPGTGKFIILDISEKVRVESVSLGCRPHHSCVLDISSSTGQVDVAAMLAEMADPAKLLRVSLTGVTMFPLDMEALREKFADSFYYLELESSNIYLNAPALQALSDEPTIRGYFVRNMLARLEDAKDEETKEFLYSALYRGVAALGGGAS